MMIQGVMSPENNFIMIIQNLWMTITSSIGYIALIPFYQASRMTACSSDNRAFNNPSRSFTVVEEGLY